MSCRVMGRQIEDCIIAAVAERAVKNGITKMKASFVPTVKNRPVAQLWDRLGFEKVSEKDGEKHYSCRLLHPMETVIKAEWSE